MDLGRCGLKGDEPCLARLADCTHLTTLIFSDEWVEWGEVRQGNYLKKSQNQGEANQLVCIPVNLPTSTHAIQLRQKNLQELAEKQNLEEIKLNIWDFGTNHSTFFLRKGLSFEIRVNVKKHNSNYRPLRSIFVMSFRRTVDFLL